MIALFVVVNLRHLLVHSEPKWMRYVCFKKYCQISNLALGWSKLVTKCKHVKHPKSWVGTGNLSANYFEATRDYGFFNWGEPRLAKDLEKTYNLVWNSKTFSESFTLQNASQIYDKYAKKVFPTTCSSSA